MGANVVCFCACVGGCTGDGASIGVGVDACTGVGVGATCVDMRGAVCVWLPIRGAVT